jgi:hypothetical protein
LASASAETAIDWRVDSCRGNRTPGSGSKGRDRLSGSGHIFRAGIREYDAHPVVSAPYDAAWQAQSIARYQQLELRGDAKLVGDVHPGSGLGQAAHEAIDRTFVKLDASRFRDLVTGRSLLWKRDHWLEFLNAI